MAICYKYVKAKVKSSGFLLHWFIGFILHFAIYIPVGFLVKEVVTTLSRVFSNMWSIKIDFPILLLFL